MTLIEGIFLLCANSSLRVTPDPRKKRELIRESAQLVLSLHRAGILKMVKDTRTNYRWINVDDDLQWDFLTFSNPFPFHGGSHRCVGHGRSPSIISRS